MIFEKQSLLNEYNKYVELAKKCANSMSTEKAFKFIEYSSLIAWYYPILHNFIDEDVERLLINLSSDILPNSIVQNNKLDDNKIVFYNGQIIDSGALTEQYLDYFIERNYKVLFVVSSNKRIYAGTKILEKISGNNNIELFIPSSKTISGRIVELYNKVVSFNASRSFLHFLPNDVLGFCTFCKLDYIKRYYIVHNDHTFWLGKLCSDYFIEFRTFGYQLSIQRRGIDEAKIALLPYYPIKQDCEFEGFPFNRENKIIGLSAASLYKFLQDPSLEYFRVIKRIIEENDNFIFCLAGNGDVLEERSIKKFIRDQDLEDKFFYLGRRNDFYQLVGNVDLLFESYPLKGGLTPLFAAVQNVPIVGLGNRDDLSGSLEDFFNIEGYKQPKKFSDFYNEASVLVTDKESRITNAKLISCNKFKKEHFVSDLNHIINGNIKNDLNESYQFTLNDDKVLASYLLLDSAKYSLLEYKSIYLYPVAIKYFYRLFISIKYHGIQFTLKTICDAIRKRLLIFINLVFLILL